jgi:hypothetical protein
MELLGKRDIWFEAAGKRGAFIECSHGKLWDVAGKEPDLKCAMRGSARISTRLSVHECD